ncbi:hypothetical protein Ocin01_05227 [Orchesella cincta]|uniref:Uncharacterized protein n=1 Tax=Orchesella cincta TaxID=48709 RepID=A0A1D2N893_ORCCI|nr:hypothetical protein Ocin01_05227 [Orchesella cincta]
MAPPLDFNPRQPAQRRSVLKDNNLVQNPLLGSHFIPTPPHSSAYQSISMMPPPSQPRFRQQYSNPKPAYYEQQSFVLLAGKHPLLPSTISDNSMGFMNPKSKRYFKIILMIILMIVVILVGFNLLNGFFGGNDKIKERVVDDQPKPIESGFEMNSPNEHCGDAPCEEEVADSKLKFEQVTRENIQEEFQYEMKTKISSAEKTKVVYSWDEDAESTIEVLAD